MRLPSITAIVQDALHTFKRFAPSIVYSCIAALVAIYMIYHNMGEHDIVYFNAIIVLLLGISSSFVCSLFTERQNFGKVSTWLMQVVNAVLLLGYYYTFPNEDPHYWLWQHYVQFVLIALALHFLVAFIPYINKGSINGFWQYNTILFNRFVLAVCFSVILFAGMTFAYLSVEVLFDTNLNDDIYGYTFVLISLVFNTWFFLAGVPENWSDLDNDHFYPHGLKILAQYILLPLVLVYLGILYAYVGKIAINWSWPRGLVSSLILGVSVIGMFAFLLLYPLTVNNKNSWVQQASKTYYIALIPLTVVLWLAIQKRIGDYGITENRYFLILLAIWLSCISLYFVFSKSKNIKILPISLSIFTLVAAVGPLSAFNVSARSQQGRLAAVLAQNNLLESGKLIAPTQELSQEAQYKIGEIASYLVENNHAHRLASWYTGNFDEVIQQDSSPGANKKRLINLLLTGEASLSGKHTSTFENFGRRISHQLTLEPTNQALPTQNYDYVYYTDYIHTYKTNETREIIINEVAYILTVSPDMTISLSTANTVLNFPLNTISTQIKNNLENDTHNSESTTTLNNLQVDASANGIKARLLFKTIRIDKHKGVYSLREINGVLLIDTAP